MTMNTAIALALACIAAGLIALGLVMLWQAKQRGKMWAIPIPALAALGWCFLLPGVVIGQVSVFRLGTIPQPFDPYGWGTLGLRVLSAMAVLALLRRVFIGRLLTPGDRARIQDGAG